MPAFCRPWQEGGVGFDYRLQMAIADKWIEVCICQSPVAHTTGFPSCRLGLTVMYLTNRC